MTTGDQELKATQERIVRFQRGLLQLRQPSQPSEFDAVASGYRLEIERMADIDNSSQHATLAAWQSR